MSGLLEPIRSTHVIYTDLGVVGIHCKFQILVSPNEDLEKDMWPVTEKEMVYERKPLLSLETGQLWKEAKNLKRQSRGQAGNINFFMVHLHTVYSFCTCSVLLHGVVRPVFLCHLFLSSFNLDAPGFPLSTLSPYSPASPWLSTDLHGQFAWLRLTVLTDSICFHSPVPVLKPSPLGLILNQRKSLGSVWS